MDPGTDAELLEPDPGYVALARELYWAEEREVGLRPKTAEGIRLALRDFESELRQAERQPIPYGEPALAGGSRLRRAVKLRMHRVLRPVSRRYDRLAADLAGLAAVLAERLVVAEGDVWRLQRALGEAQLRRPAQATGSRATEDSARVPDAYYWAFEERMRGSSEELEERLGQYEGLATELRAKLQAEEPPLWLDLGCGQGQFCEVLREWGWRVHGVDSSAKAVEVCRERGVRATMADVFEYLASHRGEEPLGVSAIQLIEHLPRGRWLEFFEAAREVLAPGGALLVETINPLNVRALTGAFFADVTHTWPGHPETLRLMALHAGFERANILYMNADERGGAQDIAIWAVNG